MRFPKRELAVVAFVSTALFTPTVAGAHDTHGRQDRLEGRAYDRMRELAHVLDERAQHAADQAADTAHHGGRDERRFLDTVFHFSRQAADFHRRMDRYRESPWDVPDEVDHLLRDARQVNRRIHDAHVFEHTWDDWDDVLDVLDQMQRVTKGFDDRDSHRFRD